MEAVTLTADQFAKLIAAVKDVGKEGPTTSKLESKTSSTFIQKFEHFNRAEETFTQYRQRLENHVDMKNITDQVLIKRIFLDSVGTSAYNEVESTIAPLKFKEISYKDIVDKVEHHLCPRPNVNCTTASIPITVSRGEGKYQRLECQLRSGVHQIKEYYSKRPSFG